MTFLAALLHDGLALLQLCFGIGYLYVGSITIAGFLSCRCQPRRAADDNECAADANNSNSLSHGICLGVNITPVMRFGQIRSVIDLPGKQSCE